MIPHDREIDHGPELFLGFAGAHRGARAGRAFSPWARGGPVILAVTRARHFRVSASCAVKLLKRADRTGSVEPAHRGRPRGSGRLAAHQAFLIECVEAQPDITMPELAAALEAERGVIASPASLSRVLCKAGFTYKKQLMASERERADGRERRREWIEKRQPRMRLQPARLVFIDETAVNTKMTRLR